jgi:GNAT superfamily N-acetyltransferase
VGHREVAASLTPPDGFEISTDPVRLDRARVHQWLSVESYWAKGRPRATQDAAIDGSSCFGVYRSSGEQVAYARLVTDGATFGWLCDVYVDETVRGLGIGTALMAAVTAHVDELGLGRVLLATKDAHGLYARSGWTPLADPGIWMVRGSAVPLDPP